MEHPTEELLQALVEKDWAVLEYIDNPSDAVVQCALNQSDGLFAILQIHLKHCS